MKHQKCICQRNLMIYSNPFCERFDIPFYCDVRHPGGIVARASSDCRRDSTFSGSFHRRPHQKSLDGFILVQIDAFLHASALREAGNPNVVDRGETESLKLSRNVAVAGSFDERFAGQVKARHLRAVIEELDKTFWSIR